jgi:Icc-related predicted phosphoesterase
MKLHLISDIHLEFADLELPGGEVLIIAGDMGEARSFFLNIGGYNRKVIAPRMKRFVAEELPKYKDYIYIPGNHEYYGRSINEAHTLLANAGLKVTLDEPKKIGDIVFYGTTLWTDANKGCPFTEQTLARGMNDFDMIEDFSVLKMRQLHAKQLGLLESFLADNKRFRTVIVTHHAPTLKSVNVKYINEREMNGGFVSDLSGIILDNPQIELWCHGHMHDYVDYTVGNTRVVCNPRGYYGHEKQAYTYKVLEINI